MTSAAQAAWPDKTVTMVVPFPPCGSTDLIGRLLASRLEAQLGQTFVIDNKAGATGTIGAAHVARAKPDGYTLLVASPGPYVIAPHLFSKAPYVALRSGERRVGKACVSRARSRWSPYYDKNVTIIRNEK